MINGSANGFFLSFRGVHHGDPLSSALFIIAVEVLTRNLKRLRDSPNQQHFSITSGCPRISHSTFVDDMLIFANGEKRSVVALMRLVRKYEAVSRQAISTSKSIIYIDQSFPTSRRSKL